MFLLSSFVIYPFVNISLGGIPATIKALLASAVTWAVYEESALFFEKMRRRKGAVV